MSHMQSYNISIFDQSLLEIFNQQAWIQTLVNRLEDFCLRDDENGINIVGYTYLNGWEYEIADCLAYFDVPYSGDMTDGEYYSFSHYVDRKLNSLNQLYSVLSQYANECSQIENDYFRSQQTYRSLRQVIEEAKNSVTTAKPEIKAYLDSCCDTISESDYLKHLNRLDAVKVDFPLPKFTIDLHLQQAQITKNIVEHKAGKLSELDKLQTGVFKLRADYSNLMNIKEMQVSRQKAQKESPLGKIKDEIAGLIEELSNQIDILDLVTKFDTLKECTDHSLMYEFRHLKTELGMRKVSVERKTDLNNRLLKLQRLPNSPQVNETIKNIQKSTASPTVKESLYVRLCSDCDAVIATEEKKLEEENIRARQVQYEKNQIIKALRQMNYEVVSDTKVIDFADNNYLFQVPNQDNFISVEYLGDKFFINFLVPERIGELSQTEKDRKVSEMSKVCSDYRKLLKILSQRGIKNEHNQLEASVDRLVALPEKMRDKVKHLLCQDTTNRNKVNKFLRMDND